MEHIALSKKIFEKKYKINQNKTIKLDYNIYNDLNIFDGKNSIFDNLNINKTSFGSEYLRLTLLYPETNYTLYQKKIEILNSFNSETIDDIENTINTIKHKEKDILWFWKEKTKAELQLLNLIIFSKNKYIDLPI